MVRRAAELLGACPVWPAGPWDLMPGPYWQLQPEAPRPVRTFQQLEPQDSGGSHPPGRQQCYLSRWLGGQGRLLSKDLVLRAGQDAGRVKVGGAFRRLCWACCVCAELCGPGLGLPGLPAENPGPLVGWPDTPAPGPGQEHACPAASPQTPAPARPPEGGPWKGRVPASSTHRVMALTL